MKEGNRLPDVASGALLQEWAHLEELKSKGKNVEEMEKRVKENLSKLYRKGDEPHKDTK